MLTVVVPSGSVFDPNTNTFYKVEKETTLQLEHSLISLQKWESRWHKPFLEAKDKTLEETVDYIRCMCLTSNVTEDVFYCIPTGEMNRIAAYIDDPMTATSFREPPSRQGPNGRRKKKEIITAEIIYYWMISWNIPTEYRKWHLNQLLTLIRVLNIKNEPADKKNKRSRREILSDFESINKANKEKFATKG